MSLEIALVYGGRSAEHDVSVRSANTVYPALMRLGHVVHCIHIDRLGIWRYQADGALKGAIDEKAPVVSLQLGRRILSFLSEESQKEVEIDVIYPALHGPWGEDGTLQGLAAMSNLPCVGSSTLGSAVAMDKDVTKKLLQYHQIAVAPWMTSSCTTMPAWLDVVSKLGDAIFVKPASLGSSVGVCRVTNEEQFRHSILDAAKFCNKIVIETEIRGREIECGILQTAEGLVASDLGEITPLGNHQFYDYDAKYDDQKGAQLVVPADVSIDVKRRIQEIAKCAFHCLGLKTLARIDFFLTQDGEIILNEVNTLPGFTSISMYPKMFASSGYSLDKLVEAILRDTMAD